MKNGAVNWIIVAKETLLSSIVLKYVNWTKYIPATPNKIIPKKSFQFFKGFNIDFFSIKMTAAQSNIPEISVLAETSQFDEKWNFLKRNSPETPEIDQRLAAELANIIPRNFFLNFHTFFLFVVFDYIFSWF